MKKTEAKRPPLQITPAQARGEPRTTDYCRRCGESPESARHIGFSYAIGGCEYADPRIPAPDGLTWKHSRHPGDQCPYRLPSDGANCCARVRGHPGPHENCFGGGTADDRWIVPRDRQPILESNTTTHAHVAGAANLSLNLRCKAHPRYQCKRRPRLPCEGCWRVWIASNP